MKHKTQEAKEPIYYRVATFVRAYVRVRAKEGRERERQSLGLGWNQFRGTNSFFQYRSSSSSLRARYPRVRLRDLHRPSRADLHIGCR